MSLLCGVEQPGDEPSGDIPWHAAGYSGLRLRDVRLQM